MANQVKTSQLFHVIFTLVEFTPNFS